VVRVRSQIRDMQRQLRSGRGGATVLAGGSPSVNPVYEQLRGQLAEARRQGAAAASRVATGQALLAAELERSRKIVGSEAEVASLTRVQDVNREIYEDLLQRRENARVSMSLDADGRSLGFQIQEPAALPLQSSGLRLMHFAGAGLALAVLVPLLLLSVLVRHDPRIRSPLQLEREAGLPVLAAIPRYSQSALEVRRISLGTRLIAVVVLGYAVALALKLADVI
jgi:uncharacterized protein involved in exopolysaccharide biosynthesis